MAEEKKMPTAQISKDKEMGATSCPRPEVSRKRSTICVLMRETLQVSMARVSTMKLISMSLFF